MGNTNSVKQYITDPELKLFYRLKKAIERNNIEEFCILLKNVAFTKKILKVRDNDGNTLLNYAIKRKCPEMIDYIVNNDECNENIIGAFDNKDRHTIYKLCEDEPNGSTEKCVNAYLSSKYCYPSVLTIPDNNHKTISQYINESKLSQDIKYRVNTISHK
jgi:hypothetical protein